MNWPEFSALLEEGFTQQGFRVERLKGVADFALSREGATTLVAARRWKAARVGEDALQALRAAALATGCGTQQASSSSPDAKAKSQEKTPASAPSRY